MANLFQVPGNADKLSSSLVKKWNSIILREYAGRSEMHSDFFQLDYNLIRNPTKTAIKWFADPAEPGFCQTMDVAKKLSNWDVRGRQVLHNEYCEYRTIYRMDKKGNLRPKRVQITTELRDYWVMLAVESPTRLRSIIRSILGYLPPWQELYGVDNPSRLSKEEREIRFSTLVAGNGGSYELTNRGVPSQPTGKINTENALFMTHPINGLDDLFYIVLFGATPYAVKGGTTYQKATKEQIFKAYKAEHLACRHADPAAAMGAYNAVFEGRSVAFANPLGMYIQSFSDGVFSYNDQPLPQSWIRKSRGNQRMEFGPSDNEDIYLDDIVVSIGGGDVKLTGGFEVVQQMEVGPFVVVGGKSVVPAGKYKEIMGGNEPIRCNMASACENIEALYQEYLNSSRNIIRTAPRTI